MRIKRILSGLLVVVMVLSMMTMNVFAADSDKVVLSDVPYDYGVVPFSEEWDELTTLERKTIFSIPKKVAESLTTEALLETILYNPYIIDLLAYDDFSTAVKLRDNQFQIKEFLNRRDSYSVLSAYISNYSKMVSARETFAFSELDKISLNIENSQELRNYVFDSLELCFMKSVESNVLPIFDIPDNLGVQTRGYLGHVCTRGGTEIACIYNKTWDDWVAEEGITASETFAITKMAGYRVLYSGLTQVAGIDPSYNCHSFAWHAPTVNNNVWIDNVYPYTIEGTPIEEWDTNIAVGTTKVVHFGYFEGSSAPSYYHSSRVYELNLDGSIKTVISKWGTLALLIHDIDECPYSTGSHTLSYYNY